MKQFDWEKFKNKSDKIAVHCKTEEEARDFCNKMYEHRMKWRCGQSYLYYTYYTTHGEETCYIGSGEYCNYEYYSERRYTILEWSDYMKKEFTKADLKDGMVVEYCNGKRRLVLNNCLIGKDGHYELNQYMEDMKDKQSSERDIMRVFKIAITTTLDRIFHIENLDLIWERKETKRMTAEEMRQKLEELTGEKIEIEPSRNEMIGMCYEFCKKQKCSNCILNIFGDCSFKSYSDTALKRCYKEVTENESTSGLERR